MKNKKYVPMREKLNCKSDSAKLARIDKEFERKAREVMRIRLQKKIVNFNRWNLGIPEFTRLLMNTPSFQKSINELENGVI